MTPALGFLCVSDPGLMPSAFVLQSSRLLQSIIIVLRQIFVILVFLSGYL